MLGAVVLVIGLGILNLNSPLDIWHAAERSERLIFFKLVFFGYLILKRREIAIYFNFSNFNQ